VWNTKLRPELLEKGLDESLRKLQLDYVDIYMLQYVPLDRTENSWPVPFQPNGTDPFFPVDENNRLAVDRGCNLHETWKVLESFLETGKVRAIGVSNFTVEHLKQLAMGRPRIMPMVNQIELHPYLSH
jgi:L-glyceraldehyde reductase